jgi:hypothetical protein
LQRDTVSRQRVWPYNQLSKTCPECWRLSEQYEEALDQYKLLHSQWRDAVAGKHIEVAKEILVRVPRLVDTVKEAQTALEEHCRTAHPAQVERDNRIDQDRAEAAWYPMRHK